MAAQIPVFVPQQGFCREQLRGIMTNPRAGPCPWPQGQTTPSSTARRVPVANHNPVEPCNNINPDLGIATIHQLNPAPARTQQQINTNGRGHVAGPIGLVNTGFVCDRCRDATFDTGRIRDVLRNNLAATCLDCQARELWRYPRGKDRCKCSERIEEAGCSECIWQTAHQLELLGNQYKTHLRQSRATPQGVIFDPTHPATTNPRGLPRCRCGERRATPFQRTVFHCYACREVIVARPPPNQRYVRPRRPLVYPMFDAATGNPL